MFSKFHVKSLYMLNIKSTYFESAEYYALEDWNLHKRLR